MTGIVYITNINTPPFLLLGLSFHQFFITFNLLKYECTFLSSISNILNVKAHKLFFKCYIDI